MDVARAGNFRLMDELFEKFRSGSRSLAGARVLFGAELAILLCRRWIDGIAGINGTKSDRLSSRNDCEKFWTEGCRDYFRRIHRVAVRYFAGGGFDDGVKDAARPRFVPMTSNVALGLLVAVPERTAGAVKGWSG